jgi:polysaccharide biosynthesis protein PslL
MPDPEQVAVNGTGTQAPRDPRLDIARGIGILLIAYWHSPLPAYSPGFFLLVKLFAVPYFFVLSGSLLRTSDHIGPAWIRRASAVVKPYAATVALASILAFLQHRTPLSGSLLGGLWGTGAALPQGWGPIWFLPLLAVSVGPAMVLARTLERRVPSVALRVVICALLLLAGALLARRPIPVDLFPDPHHWNLHRLWATGLPWSLDLVVLSATLMTLGHVLRQPLSSPGFSPVVLLVSLGVLYMIAKTWPVDMDLNRRVFVSVVPTLCAFVAGTMATLQCASLVARAPQLARALASIGRQSLFILAFHLFLGGSFHWQLIKWTGGQASPWTAGASYLFSVAGALVLGRIVQRTPLVKSWYPPGPPPIRLSAGR